MYRLPVLWRLFPICSSSSKDIHFCSIADRHTLREREIPLTATFCSLEYLSFFSQLTCNIRCAATFVLIFKYPEVDSYVLVRRLGRVAVKATVYSHGGLHRVCLLSPWSAINPVTIPVSQGSQGLMYCVPPPPPRARPLPRSSRIAGRSQT